MPIIHILADVEFFNINMRIAFVGITAHNISVLATLMNKTPLIGNDS